MPSEYVKVWLQAHQHDFSKHPDYELISTGPPIVLRHKEDGYFAARLPELALTAYADTADQARERVETMFRVVLRWYLRGGGENRRLEDRLTRNGVKWEWSEGPEDELVYP